jgi:predicted ArsR family transcriptional regulator
MDPQQLLAPEDASPLGRSRADVLDMLRAADGPLGVREIAQQMGLHPNTARFHLEALVEAGLADRESQDRETPGRPRIGYRAVAGGPGGRRRYRLLAEMLTSLIVATMPAPQKAAEEAGQVAREVLTLAGRVTGSSLIEQRDPGPHRSRPAAVRTASCPECGASLGRLPQPLKRE